MSGIREREQASQTRGYVGKSTTSPLSNPLSTSEEDETFLGFSARGISCLNHHLPQRYSEKPQRYLTPTSGKAYGGGFKNEQRFYTINAINLFWQNCIMKTFFFELLRLSSLSIVGVLFYLVLIMLFSL